jgi:hypothetical protein
MIDHRLEEYDRNASFARDRHPGAQLRKIDAAGVKIRSGGMWNRRFRASENLPVGKL